MKRCKFCGRAGTRLMELPGGYFTTRPSGEYACYDRQACGRRASIIGQWTGLRVLRRRDLNGTAWEIRRVPAFEKYILRMRYREHFLQLDVFESVDAAKAHVDDLIKSWEARSLREYGASR